jgi:hypothetical protein
MNSDQRKGLRCVNGSLSGRRSQGGPTQGGPTQGGPTQGGPTQTPKTHPDTRVSRTGFPQHGTTVVG